MTTQTLGGVAYPTGANDFAETFKALIGTYPTERLPKTKNIVVFKGTIEIMQVANGFVMNIATKEGYAYDTYIASTIQEVNERLTATMVAFKLEQT